MGCINLGAEVLFFYLSIYHSMQGSIYQGGESPPPPPKHSSFPPPQKFCQLIILQVQGESVQVGSHVYEHRYQYVCGPNASAAECTDSQNTNWQTTVQLTLHIVGRWAYDSTGLLLDHIFANSYFNSYKIILAGGG